MNIRLLRHGVAMTGGARHEERLLQLIKEELTSKGIPCKAESLVAASVFKGWQNFSLLKWSYKNATADLNIVVARCALPALLRNRGSSNKTLIVLHNFDKKDGKGLLLSLYYKALFAYLRVFRPSDAAIVTDSPFFSKIFEKMLPETPVFWVPNLFENSIYKIKAEKDPHKIFLGQWSWKNDPAVFDLAKRLKQMGYKPFFLNLYDEPIGEYDDYSIRKVPFTEYLRELASSLCTVSFTGINEGWSRLSHESLLLDTPVIGFDRGGLGMLLKESGSNIVSSAEEALGLITHPEKLKYPAEEFIERYDVSNAPQFLKPLIEFILNA